MIDIRKIISVCVLPLLPSAILTGPHEGERGRRDIVSFDTMHKMRFYLPHDNSSYFTIKRTVPFCVEEKEVVSAIALRMTECLLKHGEAEAEKAAPDIVEGVIAGAVCPECPDVLKKVIGMYRGWMEKNPPPYHCGHNIGVCLKRRAPQKNDFMRPDNLELLTRFGSTPDTLVVIDSEGSLCGIENFMAKNTASARHEIFAPIAVSGLAAWTGARHKIALRLTPQGDILLFKNRALLFARRSTGWRCLPHSLVMDEFVPGDMEGEERESRLASYLTAMDLAFGKKEACLLFVQECRPLPGLLKPANGMLQGCVKGKRFFELDRSLRADLCVLDGILLLDRKGRVLGNISGFDDAEPDALNRLLSRSIGVHVHDDGCIDIYKGYAKPFSIS